MKGCLVMIHIQEHLSDSEKSLKINCFSGDFCYTQINDIMHDRVLCFQVVINIQ